MNDIAIKVEHVSKNFVLPHEKITSIKGIFTTLLQSKNRLAETQHALKDINFKVKKGEFFGIVGRNGSGKSTMLKILAGIYQPTIGTTSTYGKLVPFIELGVGFNPELTGRANVFLNGAMLGFSRKEVAAMYNDIVEFAELEKFMDQKLKNYSSGMQVRLAFSMATRADADILLVDEVLAVGDADFQRKCFGYFKELKRKKKTIVFISHDMNSIREYCDRAILIDDSEIICEGSPVKVSTEYSKLFLDTAPGTKNTINDNRWGNETARILKPKVTVKSGIVELNFTVQANEGLEDFILGYVIADSTGKQLCGTNTQLLGEKLPPIMPGLKYDYTFSLENIFVDGNYSTTLAVHKDGGTVVADWWADAVAFTVKKAQHNPYLVEAPVTLTYKENYEI